MRILLLAIGLLFGLTLPATADEVTRPPVAGYWWRLPVIPEPNWLPGHRGLDYQVGAGTAVRAPRSGTVTFVGSINFVSVITVTDSTGIKHSFLPVSSALQVGDFVVGGEVIGKVVSGSHCSVTCLHWGVRKSSHYIDPRWLLPRWVVRLPIHARG